MKVNERNLKRPEYSGVVAVDEANGVRLCVSARGSDYVLQRLDKATGLWSELRRGPRSFVMLDAALYSDALAEAAESLPDDAAEFRASKRSAGAARSAATDRGRHVVTVRGLVVASVRLSRGSLVRTDGPEEAFASPEALLLEFARRFEVEPFRIGIYPSRERIGEVILRGDA